VDYAALVRGPYVREREGLGREGEIWNGIKLFAKNILNRSQQVFLLK